MGKEAVSDRELLGRVEYVESINKLLLSELTDIRREMAALCLLLFQKGLLSEVDLNKQIELVGQLMPEFVKLHEKTRAPKQASPEAKPTTPTPEAQPKKKNKPN
jgi:hypothetical protein